MNATVKKYSSRPPRYSAENCSCANDGVGRWNNASRRRRAKLRQRSLLFLGWQKVSLKFRRRRSEGGQNKRRRRRRIWRQNKRRRRKRGNESRNLKKRWWQIEKKKRKQTTDTKATKNSLKGQFIAGKYRRPLPQKRVSFFGFVYLPLLLMTRERDRRPFRRRLRYRAKGWRVPPEPAKERRKPSEENESTQNNTKKCHH